MPESKLCVACGEQHADEDTATRVGIALIARECTWTLRYPGKQAYEVIEFLEEENRRRLEGRPPAITSDDDVEAVVAAHEERAEQELGIDPDSLRLPGGRSSNGHGDEPGPGDVELPPDPSGKSEKLCPACGGDGEIEDPENAGSFVPCARCDTTGRIVIAP